MNPHLLRLALLGAATLAAAAAAARQIGGDDPNRPELLTEPYEYVSDKGLFTVTWPSGCGELVRRESVEDPDVDPFEQVSVFNVYCDQHGEHGVGCSVTSLFNLKGPDGGMPVPEQVVSRMEDHMKKLGVQVVRQGPIGRNMPDGTRVEGLDIQAKDPEGKGEAWLRGLLYEGDIYLLSAWKLQGGLWSDPEYQEFFDSFAPLVE